MNPKTRVREALAALLALVLLVPVTASAAPAESEPVKLVVIISVDGLSWPRLSSYKPWLDSGLKRLLDEGQVETNAHYKHINTETCPGHASLATGAPPKVHGIVANAWFAEDPDDGNKLRSFYCAEQKSVRRGPAHLQVSTLGDQLIQASPKSRVVSFSGKDRSAIYLAGKKPDHVVYWYNRDNGQYVSSDAYTGGDAGDAAKALIKKFNEAQAGEKLVQRFGTVWRRLAEPAKADLPRPEPNIALYQMPGLGLGFDHNLAINPTRYYASIYDSPFQDELLADLALAALADPGLALGQRGVPDLLALSFAAQDVVSHNLGNESEEELDTLRRLDVQLGRVLKALDELAAAEPKGQVVVALSADHGFAPLPEVQRRQGGKRVGGRLMSDEGGATPFPSFRERLNRALAKELCLEPEAQPIYGVEGWNVAYNNKPLRTLVNDKDNCEDDKVVETTEVDKVLRGVVLRHFDEEVKDVLLVSEINQWTSNDDAIKKAIEFARNDFYTGRSGNAFIIPEKYVLMHWDPVRGSGHGSHHEYDTHVPLIFWGGPFKAGERTGDSTPYDLAPTLADILGIKLDEKATGKSRLQR